jgi:excisionase family DNA binding protein
MRADTPPQLTEGDNVGADGPGRRDDLNDIARILKLNRQTVRNWIDRGELPAMHVGRRVRVRRADFDAMIEAGYSGVRRSQHDRWCRSGTA